MQAIHKSFPITEGEYRELYAKFGALCHYASWQLIKRNSRNNHTEDEEDFAQELQISLIRAASYYKRQVYIEQCLNLCERYVTDEFLINIVANLKNLWINKTRHGANKQKFGPHQEQILETLTRKIVPRKARPCRHQSLQIDQKFTTYCKAIAWNAEKALGKKITREIGVRATMASLSEHEYLM